ncbi:PAS domain S-box protein [Cecembia rubra]|uniref:histidine kinase n=1 Tax=Cecembia rubra TaxID=1485585 RepID=A0A2P8DVH3_9BACT|nr:PAS domain S-box protein [Cecembia rubra]PSL01209.1 PAS domain S-box-containing protein [Cecembia rubra]
MEKVKSYNYFNFFYKKPIASGLLGFLIAFVLSQLITLKDYQIHLNQEKEEVLSYSSLIIEKINTVLKDSFSAASILTFLHGRVDFDKEFAVLGEEILDKFPLIDAVQWNQGGIIKYVYPLEGNEASLGLDILNDTLTHKSIEAKLAIEKGELFFAGPFELKQEGMGIVGRLPIYREGDFFAFSVVIVRLETFLALLDYNPEEENKYYVQFSKINPGTGIEEFFLPEENGYNGFRIVNKINEGNWILSIQLKKSDAFKKVLPQLIFRTFFSLICGMAILFLAKLPSILNKEVAKKSKELRKTIKRFKMASKATSDAIWEWDFVKDRIYRSPNFVKLFGYSYSFFNMKQELFEELIHPEDLQRTKSNFQKFLEGKELFWEQEFRFLKENGDYAYVVDKGILLRNKSGMPVKFYGAIQDISLLKEREIQLINFSERLDQRAKELQEAIYRLEESEKRYRELFELSPLPMWVFDLETLRFLDVNDAAVNNYGFSKEEFLSMTIKDIRGEEDIAALEEKVSQRKEINGLVFSGVYRHIKKNGQSIDVEISSNKINYKGKIVVLVLAVDVTLRNKYVGAIEIQNAKLREIAWLQSHIVRAPLARLLGLIYLLKDEMAENPDQSLESLAELMEYIISSAKELDDVIREITEKTESINYY